MNNEKNLGKGGALNKGLKVAKGELVVVVDADSYPSQTSIKKMVGFLGWNDKLIASTEETKQMKCSGSFTIK